MRQSLPEGTTYDLSKATEITLTVAKKVTSVPMPSYIGSSLEFTKNNLIQIVGVKEANIEVVEVSTAPEGTIEDTVVSQSPKPGEGVDLNTTRIKISIYNRKQQQRQQILHKEIHIVERHHHRLENLKLRQHRHLRHRIISRRTIMVRTNQSLSQFL